jgi:hypothetical protein
VIHDWWEIISDDTDLQWMIAIGVIILVVFVLGSIIEQDNWEKYATSHHCQSRGVKKGWMEPVLGGKGGVTMGQDQTIYVCDGGEIIIR